MRRRRDDKKEPKYNNITMSMRVYVCVRCRRAKQKGERKPRSCTAVCAVSSKSHHGLVRLLLPVKSRFLRGPSEKKENNL